jgi:hypothetical protein
MFEGNQLREKLRAWLVSPDPSINHNTACDTQHQGTGGWFLQGSTLNNWKKNGSVLWVHGNRTLPSRPWPFMTIDCFSNLQRGPERVFSGMSSYFHSGLSNLNHP